MTAKTKFETGKDYTLANLFSNDNKIIIPDLQRDYCWGAKDNLAQNFINSLFDYYENSKKNKKLSLGIFYAYEEPIGHIQLCDGQQRLTTLFLLIGMLNRYSKKSEQFRNFLISNERMNDDKEPYLLYSIRESTLYFLSDLIVNIFFSKNVPVDKIKEQSWYFKDYDLDQSIQNILEVLLQVENILRNKNDTDIVDFANFLINDLTFLYYDMGSRKNGEETFVIINTTGEPLTATENLKPLLLSRIENEKEKREGSDTWEKWENFFWINRLENDTADNGLKEFFRWIMLLSLDTNSNDFMEIQDSGKFVFDKTISIKEIDSYYKIIVFLKEHDIVTDFEQYLAPENSNNQIDWFRVLPLIKYIKKWGSSNLKEIKRIHHFFYNLAKIDNVGKAISDLLPESLRIIDEMPTSDICSLLEISDISKIILTDEEKFKLEIYRNNPQIREQLEENFWQAEDTELWNGEIKTLLLWSSKGKLNVKNFSFDKFVEYSQKLDKLFTQEDLDMLRRTLLTFIDNGNYPKILHGHTNYSFCNTESDWKTILCENIETVQKFLDSLNLKDDIIQQQEKLMTRPDCCPLKYNLEQLIIHKEILKCSENKNFQWSDEAEDWLIIPKTNATKYANLSNYVLYWEIKKSGKLCNSELDDNDFFSVNNIQWRLWFYMGTDGNCCVVSSEERDIYIDLNSGNKKYRLNIRDESKTAKIFMKQLGKDFNFTFNDGRYYSTEMNKKELITLLQKLLNYIK